MVSSIIALILFLMTNINHLVQCNYRYVLEYVPQYHHQQNAAIALSDHRQQRLSARAAGGGRARARRRGPATPPPPTRTRRARPATGARTRRGTYILCHHTNVYYC